MNDSLPVLGFVTVHVADVWRTQQWYQDVFGLRPQYLAPDGSYVELVGPGFVLALCTHVLGRHSCGDGVRPTSLLEPAVGCHLSFFTVDLAATYAQALLHGAVGLSAPASRPWGRNEACVRNINGLVVVVLETEEPRPAVPAV